MKNKKAREELKKSLMGYLKKIETDKEMMEFFQFNAKLYIKLMEELNRKV